MTMTATQQRLCSDCENGYLGSGGVFCMAFREPIDDERVAQDCPEFDPLPNGDRPPEPPEVVTAVATDEPEPEDPAVVVQVLIKRSGRAAGKGVQVIDEDLADECESYLASRHSTLWGEAFEIVTPKGRRQAAEWLADQIRGLGADRAGGPG